ncbi:unnamed protein product, partial [Musa hybrid cultivar]
MRKERASKLIEPDYTEYISALPAGKRTQLMVDAGPSGGISPSTLSLAAAAQQTCGKVICVRHEQADVEVARRQIETLNLTGVVESRLGRSLHVVEQLRNVDFAVVDYRMECWKFVATVRRQPLWVSADNTFIDRKKYILNNRRVC